MTAYANGDEKAFGMVYDAVAPRLQGFLRKKVRDDARVEDIVQQTFLQMHAARGTFIPGAQVLPWAIGIAKHLMIDARRKSWREDTRDLGDEDEVHACGWALTSQEATGEEVLQAAEMGQRMVAAYGRLSEPQRLAMDLRKSGMSSAQIAGALHTTITGVKLRIHRAMLALRAASGGDRE